MRRRAWDRTQALDRLRSDVWRYLSPAASSHGELEVEAAALLQMSPIELRRLGLAYFVLSDEVRALLDAMPRLVRQLANTTERIEEWSADRVRGPVQWSATFAARAATGIPTVHVTSPARRAFETPENDLLVEALRSIAGAGRRSGWHRSDAADAGRTVRDRVADAERWLMTRMLAELRVRPVTASVVRRVRTGRRRRRYAPAVEVVLLYRALVRRVDPTLLRTVVESHGLASRKPDVLLELETAFAMERQLRADGWHLSHPGLVAGGQFVVGTRGSDKVTLFYQHAPPELAKGSRYRQVQEMHAFASVGALRPDFVVRFDGAERARWLLVEVKGVERPVEYSARAAALDLLAYRRAFGTVLDHQSGPYGLGVAWGSDLRPDLRSEIVLATPDTAGRALSTLLDSFASDVAGS